MFVISVGINVSLLFHDGELTCFSLIGNDEFCCHTSNDPKPDSCSFQICDENDCQIEYVNITLEDEFLINSSEYASEYVFQSAQGFHQPPLVNSLAVEYFPNRANPPPKSNLYLEYSSFLFYG